MDVTFTELKENSLQLFNLYTLCNPKIDISLEKWDSLFDWAFKKNPFRGEKPLGLEVRSSTNDLIAFSTLIYLPFRTNENLFNISSIGVICVSPEYQGTFGIKFVNDIADRLDNFFCSHSSKLYCMMWSRMGADEVETGKATYKGLVSLKNIISSKGSFCKIFSTFIPFGLYKIFLNKHSRRDLSQRIKFGKRSGFENCLNEIGLRSFLDSFTGECSSLNRNWNYFRWRYLDHPYSSKFLFVAINDDGKYKGIAILVKSDSITYSLYEVFSHNGYEEELLAKIIQSVNSVGGVYLLSRYNTSQFEKLFIKYNFEKSEKEYSNLVYKSSSQESNEKMPFCFADLKMFT